MDCAVLLLPRYIEYHNDGVRTGDFGPMLALFDPDARMEFTDGSVGPFTSRHAIAAAFESMPPDDELVLLERFDCDSGATASYRWHGNGDAATGTITLHEREGLIVRLVID